jgi:hypothetical protein
MDILLPEFKQILLLLNKHKVNYMLIGGYAVIYYGYERNTTDMDIWLKPDNKNRDALIKALKEFGIMSDDLNTLGTKDFSQIQFFFFGKKPRRIDFLTHISGITYDKAEQEVNYFQLSSNEKIPIIQYHHLILSKISNERSKDKTDVDELQKINQFKSKE